MKKFLLALITAILMATMVGCTTAKASTEQELGETAEEICVNQVIQDYCKEQQVLGTNSALWYTYENEKATDVAYMVQIDSTTGSSLWLVRLTYIKQGSKISSNELIECYVMSKVR